MSRRIAVMQPYLLPYIGYFQLMAAVDRFVLLEDVNYINRGWVNRNRILLGGKPHLFTLPLRAASQNRLICEIERVGDPAWARRLLRTLHQAYSKAPHYAQVAPVLERIVGHDAPLLGDYLHHSLLAVREHLGLDTDLVRSRDQQGDAALKGQERILDICRREGAAVYVNAIGGTELYEREAFAAQGVQLRFLKPRPTSYLQWGGPHLPWLSIVDVLMFNSRATARALLAEADLV